MATLPEIMNPNIVLYYTVQFQYFQLFVTEDIGTENKKSRKYRNRTSSKPKFLTFAE
jgi:hypothetical protein